jgi:hypothetical protein
MSTHYRRDAQPDEDLFILAHPYLVKVTPVLDQLRNPGLFVI